MQIDFEKRKNNEKNMEKYYENQIEKFSDYMTNFKNFIDFRKNNPYAERDEDYEKLPTESSRFSHSPSTEYRWK